MKREGKQHGMVRNSTKAIATTNPAVNFTKASPKPTGHSRHTGKCKKARCTQCHSHPVSKSRDKAKGSYKLKSSDVVLNHRLVSWRVADDRNNAVRWSGCSGVSASGVLDALLADSSWSQGDGEGHHDHHEVEQEHGYGDGYDYEEESGINQEDDYNEQIMDIADQEDADNEETMEEEEEEEEDDDMGFYEVGFVWEYVDEEGWCVVGEM